MATLDETRVDRWVTEVCSRIAGLDLRFAAIMSTSPGVGDQLSLSGSRRIPDRIAALFAPIRGALIISFHGADLRDARGVGRIERALWRFVLHSATAIVACSKAFATEVSEFAGKEARNVHAIQNGLDVNHFLETRGSRERAPCSVAQSRIHTDRRYVGVEKRHRCPLASVLPNFGAPNANISLVLIGRASEAESSLRTLAVELGIANEVLFFESVLITRLACI